MKFESKISKQLRERVLGSQLFDASRCFRNRCPILHDVDSYSSLLPGISAQGTAIQGGETRQLSVPEGPPPRGAGGRRR
ncbi:MAG: hypothetical protein ACK56I_32910, partial [bacterium]